MSQKRDEICAELVKDCDDIDGRDYDLVRKAWDMALLHDERVLALVECLEKLAQKPIDYICADLDSEIDVGEISDMCERALTPYKESIE